MSIVDTKNANNFATPILEDRKLNERKQLEAQKNVRMFQEKLANKNKYASLGSSREINNINERPTYSSSV